MARRLAHWFLSLMGATSLPARRKAGSYGVLSLLERKSGNAHTASARKSRENASERKSGRRRPSSQMPSCNGMDRVKVRKAENQTNRGPTSESGNADDGESNRALFSGIAGDPMQQVVLCSNWCTLEWMIVSTSLLSPSSRVELESRMC